MDKKRIEEIALKKASDFIIDAVGEGNLIIFVHDLIEAIQGEAVPVGYIDAKDLAKSGNSRIIAKCLGPYAGLTTPVFTAPPAALPPAYIFDQASGSAAPASAPAVPEGYSLVSNEIINRFPEINPSNYNHDDACALNSWGVELVLSLAAAPAPEVK